MTVFADRVKDTTTTTGTGTVTLANSAPTGYRTFAAGFAVGDVVPYCIALGAEWESGVGTLTSSTALARTTVLASSNGGAAVNFSSGAKDVFCTLPSALVAGGPLAVQALSTSASTLTLNFTPNLLETAIALTLTQNVTITIGNAPAGYEQRMLVELIQDSTGGRVATFVNPTWAGAIAPTLDTSALRRNAVQFRGVGSDIAGAAYSINRVPNIPAVPTAPSSITVTPGNAQNIVNASTVLAYPAVTGYSVYRGTSAGAEGASPIATNVSLPYTDTGRTNGTTYYYKVAAVNSVGTGAQSPEGSGTPTAGIVNAIHYATFGSDIAAQAIYSAPISGFNPGSATFEMQATINPTSFTSTNPQCVIGCWDGITPAFRLWQLALTTDGRIRASWATSSTVFPSAQSNVLGATLGNDITIKAVVNPTAGTVNFYKSLDGTTFTQVGTTVTASSSGAVYTPSTLPYLVISCNATAGAGGPSKEEYVGRVIECRFTVGATLITHPVMGPTTTVDTVGLTYGTSATGVVYV